MIISYYQVRPLLQNQQAVGESVKTSMDLGMTQVSADIVPEGVQFPSGECLNWDAVEKISESENNCFLVEGDEVEKVITFSPATNRAYSLFPTSSAPTILISGISMHRIKGTDPLKDTRTKIKTIAPLVGNVLDTATGLGYTATEAAKTADRVTTIELDPVVLDIARLNPWSRDLFENKKIEQKVGDSFDVIREFEDQSFSSIIHDPPMFNMAGHLYSSDFYGELLRVLRQGGRLFHYIGNPQTRSGGSTTRGVIDRLGKSGFRRVARRPQAFGVVAIK